MADFSQAFNVVLNAPGVSSFVSALGKAGSAVSSVSNEIDKIKTASQLSGKTLELQQTQYDKLSARVDATGARLAAYRLRVEESNAALTAHTRKQAEAESALQSIQNKLGAAQASYSGLQNTAGVSSETLKNQEQIVRMLSSAYDKQKASLAEVTAETEKARLKNDILNKTLKVRQAGLGVLSTQAEIKGQPLKLTGAEKVVADAMKIYNSIRKLSYQLQDTQNIFQRFRAFGEFFGVLKPKAESAANALDRVHTSSKNLEKTTTSMTRPGFGLMSMASALGNIAAQVVVNGINMVAQSIMGLGQAALSASGDQERLIYSIRAMLGQQKTQLDSTLNMNEAMKQSTKEASEYIKWIEKFSILSPFTATDIKLIFQNAMGMGMNAEQAKRVTEATTNWAAATGKAGYAMSLAQYALSQMNQAAKLNMQDVRQLAQQGIGWGVIQKQLAKDLGKTTQEIQRMQDAGQILGSQGATAVLNYMESFGEAAKAQAGTLQGLMSSLQELGPMFMRNIFGPVDETTAKVGGVLGALQTRMAKFVDFLQTDFAQKTALSIGETLGNVAESALSWGESLVANFAQGIYNGAMYVVQALTDIADVVSYWLSPGSPPKILPNIDKWGTLTLTEYMKGWKLTDFSSFNELAGSIEGYLRSLPSDVMPENTLLESIVGTRADITNAINQLRTVGSVAQSTIDSILSKLGNAPQFMRDYVKTFFDVAKQQKVVNDLTKFYDDQLAEIDKMLSKIDQKQNEYLEDNRASQLELIANDPNATAQEKAMARYEMEKIAATKRKRQLEAEKEAALKPELEKLNALQEQLAIQQQLMQIQQQQNGLVQQYLDAIKEALNAATGGGGKGAPKPGGGIVGKPKTPTAPVDPKTMYEQMGAAQTAPINELALRFGLLARKIGEIFDTIKQKWDEAAPYVEAIRLALGYAWEEIKKGFVAAWETVNKQLEKSNLELPTLKDILLGVAYAIVVAGAVLEFIIKIIGFVIAVIIKVISWFRSWDDEIQGFKNAAIAAFLLFKEKWDEYVKDVKENWDKFISGATTAFENFKRDIGILWEKIKKAAVEAWQNLVDEVMGEEGLIATFIKDFNETDWGALGTNIITGIIGGLTASASNLYTTIRGIISSALNAGQDESDSGSPSKASARMIGEPIAQGIAVGALSQRGLVNRAMASLVGGMINTPMSGGQMATNYHYETSNINNFNYSPVYNSPAASPIRDFAIMKVWAGN